ncbi:pyrroloquinoline quinone biosynthesis protein PqqB [Streptomyces sp. NPDC002896]|uniref:pyrroloquinoline quinone biosynthesis protein PqqB n=1 Tax=Streptomyces sp. NPDC002896 TaxID=3154438 RepID=UPI00331FD4AE
MLLKVLGTAAGGGVPQWNCACRECSGARGDPRRRRRHASLAVEASEGRWYVVNATPDIADQIEGCPELHPGPERRRTPLAGVVLTDAELDHTLGIARLREAERLELLATEAVRDAVLERQHLGDLLAPYTELTWRELPVGGGSGLRGGGGVRGRGAAEPLGTRSTVHVSAIPVSGKRPRYAATDTAESGGSGRWVTALRLTDRSTGRTAVYAPALGAWPEALEEAVAEADCVILDGTFWDDDEPRRSGFSARTATAMGHLPIDGPQGTARRLASLPARCLYTHLNNTNPLVDPAAPQHKALARLGIEVAADGMEIVL